MKRDETTTTLDSSLPARAPGADAPMRDALVVVWAAEDAARVGEVVLLPPASERRAFVFGRGDGDDGPRERARLVRQRPGSTEEMPPLASNHLSRAQLALRSHPDGGIAIENVGKRALVVGGRTVDSARAKTGDLVEIGSQMVLLCTSRPASMPPMRAKDHRPSFAFGDADASGYVGESPEAWRLRDDVALVAQRREHVLVLGESGAGKELVAQAIHALGPRAGRRFVARNAATVPTGIIDAELFGNAANYPNAGMPERPGLVGEADGSTLFLDEIGELPQELQTHLLRLLDGGEYQRLGDARRRVVDVRVVGATNRPIKRLKSDLAARFAVRVRVPGLHERREDVMLIARHVLRGMVRGGDAHTARFVDAKGEPAIAKDLAVALLGHFYTTHAREVRNVLMCAALESRSDAVSLTKGARELLALEEEGPAPEEGERVREVTREEIVEALARHDGVRAKVWRDLGLASRYVLKRLMKKHGLDDDDD